MVVRLAGNGSSLVLHVGENGWTRCRLGNGGELELGADDVEHIAKRLIAALDEGGTPVEGEISGHGVGWVLSLAECHSTLYLARSGDDRLLLWQDRHARFIGETRLTPARVERWRTQLEELL